MGSLTNVFESKFELANAKGALHVPEGRAFAARSAVCSATKDFDRVQEKLETMLAKLQVLKGALLPLLTLLIHSSGTRRCPRMRYRKV